GVRAVSEDGVAVRLAPADPRPRTPRSYLPGARNVGGLSDSAAGRYVLLAACQPGQTAKEVLVDGAARGAFSVALERALVGLGGRPTYLDVQRAVAASVRNLALAQWPVLEAPHAEDVNRPFLGGVAGPAVPTLSVSYALRQGWVLDAGRMHGIGPRTPTEPTEVALYPMTGDLDAAPLATATVVQVAATSSVLYVADTAVLDTTLSYRARLTRAGQPQAVVAVTGAGAVADRIRDGLRASAVVRLAQPSAGQPPAVDEPAADLILTQRDGALALTRPGAARALAAVWDIADPATPDSAVRTAEHIGRWLGIATRQNPTSTLRADQVWLEVRDAAGNELGAGGAPIEVRYQLGPDGVEVNPVIAVHLVNSGTVALHCALLVLGELYGVSCLTVGGSVLLEPGTRTVVTGPDGEPVLQTFVPDGLERTTDLLTLFVSTEPFDAQPLAQEDLCPPSRTRGAELGARGIGGRPMTPSRGPDWATRQRLVTTVRPAPSCP
ncbi:MAG TPA: hypothetical protein VGH89_10265, partial [Pseudonocardia sp.]